jgi:hypothetical protein
MLKKYHTRKASGEAKDESETENESEAENKSEAENEDLDSLFFPEEANNPLESESEFEVPKFLDIFEDVNDN